MSWMSHFTFGKSDPQRIHAPDISIVRGYVKEGLREEEVRRRRHQKVKIGIKEQKKERYGT